MDFEFLSHVKVVMGIVCSMLGIVAALIVIWQSGLV